MTVGADHHSAWECVVLENNLVNDAAAWAPKTNAVFRRDRTQKVVDLFIGVDCDTHVDACASFGQDQVIAMHSGRHSSGR